MMCLQIVKKQKDGFTIIFVAYVFHKFIQKMDLIFFLASDCPQHKSDGLNEGKASYYPVPKIFPWHEIRLYCAANESESKISLSQEIISKFSAVTSADDINIVRQCCGVNGNCFNTTRIIGSPPDYLIVTIKALIQTNEGIDTN